METISNPVIFATHFPGLVAKSLQVMETSYGGVKLTAALSRVLAIF
jgi:hypothetical protein